MITGIVIFLVVIALQIRKACHIFFNKNYTFRNIVHISITIISVIFIVAVFKRQNAFKNSYLNIILGIYSILVLLSYIIEHFQSKMHKEPDVFYLKKAIDESENGALILSNDRIIVENNLMYNLIKKLEISNNYIENIKKKSVVKLENGYLLNINNKDYLFDINDNAIFAYDITEEYEYTKILDDKNKILAENNKEIVKSIKYIEDVQTQMETQNLKNRFHDILGQNLTVLHHYLTNETKTLNIKDIRFMIKKMFIDIKEDTLTIDLDSLNRIYKNIGVNINIKGKLPENKEVSNTFLKIIRESITNAIKHADSKNIDIKLSNYIDIYELEISNDGFKCKTEIKEHGGITGIRNKVKRLGGILKITPEDNFRIKISVKK